MQIFRSLSSVVAFSALACAQVVGIDDLDPLTGASNTFPFRVSTGQTSLHVYSVQTLRAQGVCAGAVLTDFAVAPSATTFGTTGTYNAPQARLQIGHLAVSPPVAGNWTGHLHQPITVHDVTSGPYTFPWTLNTYVSLPGMATTGFVWDGLRDVGVLYTSSAGTGGLFEIRRSATQLRHYVPSFGATTQTPSNIGLFAMEAKMTWTPGTNCAVRTAYGTGCYDGFFSFHQTFIGLPQFDLAGTTAVPQTLRGFVVPTGYTVASTIGTWRTPTSAPVLANTPTATAMGDNTMSTPILLPWPFPFPGGSTSVIHVAANGYVLLGTTTSNVADSSPTSAELVAQQPRLCPLWCDLHPGLNLSTNPQSGIYVEDDPLTQAVYVTWQDCADRRGIAPIPGTTSVNVQCVLYANGEFEYRYGTMVPGTGGGNVLTGFSPGNAFGGASRDPGSVDLSASLPLTTTGPDVVALALDATFPALGATIVLTTTNVPNLVPLTLTAFGDQQVPGVDLAFLGAAGCRLYSSANLTFASAPAATGSSTLSVPLPVDPLLIGASLTAQSIAFSFANPLNLITSNGVLLVVGN